MKMNAIPSGSVATPAILFCLTEPVLAITGHFALVDLHEIRHTFDVERRNPRRRSHQNEMVGRLNRMRWKPEPRAQIEDWDDDTAYVDVGPSTIGGAPTSSVTATARTISATTSSAETPYQALAEDVKSTSRMEWNDLAG